MAAILVRVGSILAITAMMLNAFADLSPQQTKLLKDPAGWDYIKMSDTGIQTEHPCFDGKPPTEECNGRLIFTTDGKFTQSVTIHGQTVPRHGTYTLENDQLTFVDELETKDGPYTVEMDPQAKTLVLFTASVRIELTLHKALQNRRRREPK
jgi:hypothetical protein